jgi:hypothetical protein
MDTTTTENKEVKVTLRINSILYGRIKVEVEKRRARVGLFSINDWIKETIRSRLDGPFESTVEFWPKPQPGVTYKEGPNPGYPAPTQPPIPLFAPMTAEAPRPTDGFWDRWTRESKSLDGDARDASFQEAIRERGLTLPLKFMKWAPATRLAWLRANDTGTAKAADW